ncbi:MAG TPA: HAD family hydrolase [Paludibaculum sp.]|jgi:phosphoglycolate phosphatase-like HAD superfamily hydrolase
MASLVLFDIDGTLVSRAGPHHRQALEDACLQITGLSATTQGIPVQGMLDCEILRQMLAAVGAAPSAVRAALPAVMTRAQYLYSRSCPDIRDKVCPGVAELLPALRARGAVLGLVTGNLSRIAWKKMARAGLKPHFTFGAFAEQGPTRNALARLAVRHARSQHWIARQSRITLIGDHPNDIAAARAAGIRSVAVGTGLVPLDELARHRPDQLVTDLRALDPAWLFEQ